MYVGAAFTAWLPVRPLAKALQQPTDSAAD
jgi:hypothetical protein